MTSCAEVRDELVALLRGETPAETAAAMEEHIDRCTACTAERDALLRTMDVVHRHVQPELSADARLRFSAALTEELARSHSWTSRRRWRPLVAIPVALAAGAFIALWLAPSGRTQATTAAVREAAAPPATIDVDAQRAARAVVTAGELGLSATGAATRGLEWLASQQSADGTWAASADSDPETTAAVTASALLAFAADGQSAHHGAHRAKLAKARKRLLRLVEEGFSTDAERKPVYAQALAVRALASLYQLDRTAMPSPIRREMREIVGMAGRRLVDWQGKDGGYGYVPRAPRSDASCTLFAMAALDELHAADLLDATGAQARAEAYLDTLRTPEGNISYMYPDDRRGAPVLTAAMLALHDEDNPSPAATRALNTIETALASSRGDVLLAWTGSAALARHGRSLAAPVKTLLDTQRDDGAWTAAGDRHCTVGGDAVTTAFGVLALAQVYTGFPAR